MFDKDHRRRRAFELGWEQKSQRVQRIWRGSLRSIRSTSSNDLNNMVKLIPPMKDFFSSAVHVAEDDQLRSNYARDLIQSSQYVAPPPSANSHPIPRRIVQYWDTSNDMP